MARRPDGRWRARYRGADGKERAKHLDWKIDAERWLTSMRSKVDRGDWVDPTLGRITAGDVLTWVAELSGEVSHRRVSVRPCLCSSKSSVSRSSTGV